jgi:hypothetical protein
MKTKTKQDADPETNQPGTDAGPEPLNSVLMAQGAERLEFIRGLIDEPEPETEVKDDPDSDTQTDETPPAEPAEPATDETEEGEPDEGEEEQETDETDETDEQQSDDEIPGIKPEVQQAINRRIGKEVAKRRAAEARIEALETKLEQLSQQPPAQQPQTAQLLDQVSNETELESVLDQAREARNYARDASDRLADESEAVIAELRAAGVRIAEDAELEVVDRLQRACDDAGGHGIQCIGVECRQRLLPRIKQSIVSVPLDVIGDRWPPCLVIGEPIRELTFADHLTIPPTGCVWVGWPAYRFLARGCPASPL